MIAQVEVIYVNQHMGKSDTLSMFSDQSLTFSPSVNTYYLAINKRDGSMEIIPLADISQIVFDGVVGISDGEATPARAAVTGNHPNPCNRYTIIDYELQKRGMVTLDVCDIVGTRLCRLVDGMREGGTHQAVWNVDATIGFGVYFYRLTVDGRPAPPRMMLVTR